MTRFDAASFGGERSVEVPPTSILRAGITFVGPGLARVVPLPSHTRSLLTVRCMRRVALLAKARRVLIGDGASPRPFTPRLRDASRAKRDVLS